MSDDLEYSHVYKHLDWVPTWRGIPYLELALMAVPALVYVGFSVFFDVIPKSYAIEILTISAVVLFSLRYRQPAGWISRELNNLSLPRFLSHRIDVEQPPYPVPQDKLWPRP
jgi:hypothetical protein